MSSTTNTYSQRWHETFHRNYDPEVTKEETEFLAEWLPVGRVLDVCCGYGRHRAGLVELGYEWVGSERDPEIAAAAGALCLDAREVERVPGKFDGVICMWASFGLFSGEENRCVLEAMKDKLRAGGRLVLDLQNRAFFASHQGTHKLRPGIHETSQIVDGRRHVLIEYEDGVVDRFDFELFTPDELRELVALPCVFERSSSDEPRMLFVFEK